ncbi:SirB2 family protein [Shewanella intestini]|uniref:SirB2 family protein n=1 Tax=Shewanella intestini TaxID=2017544 RepID=A0ABS5I858_9GAMM|nr:MULTISPECIES: SirB2 family protein [Shewanella]MBR9729470.1 SirB2 family protein [Shewanella intestini]MRG35069.1 invasion protein [Shewanella sp. XMDDZSB0408]
METFYSLYPTIKQSHLLFIGLSVLLFMVRFALHLKQSPLLDKKLMKIAPHVIDTFLLLSGVTLCFMIKQYPGVDPWMTEKIICVISYILLGIMALKSNRNKLFKFFAFIGALGWLVLAAKLAHFKQVVLMG